MKGENYFPPFSFFSLFTFPSSSMYPIHFAPLQGYTEDAYRRIHADMFSGVDTYYTPFLRIEHGSMRSKDMRDIRPEFNVGVNVVPQIIASDAAESQFLIESLKAYGYKRIDINMGCPFPLQTRHGRGAGLFANIDKVQDIAENLRQHEDVEFSVKMRLGLDASDQWKQVLPILNDLPLTHITLHPRIATQQYKGALDMEQFDAFLKDCKHPLIYNGELASLDDIRKIEAAYGDSLSGVMIGRGLLARPSLAQEYAKGEMLSERMLISQIKTLHTRLHEHYSGVIPGESQLFNKLRTFWDFMEPTIGRKAWKKIVKAGNMKNYFKAIDEL